MSYKRNQTRYSKKKKINKTLSKKGQKKLAETIRFYRSNPIKFAEDFYGVKLYGYQKIYLKLLWNKRLSEVF